MTRQIKQKILGFGFLVILILSVIWPFVGALTVFFCMTSGISLSFFQGRKWCDWYCPRGSFLESYASQISFGKKIPRIFFNYFFRILFIFGLFSLLTFNLVISWPNFDKMALIFVRTFLATTVFSLILSIFFKARTWCMLCPVGTITGLIGGRKKPLVRIQKNRCVDCKICTTICPLDLAPYKSKQLGKFIHLDCLRCQNCIAKCPKKALTLK